MNKRIQWMILGGLLLFSGLFITTHKTATAQDPNPFDPKTACIDCHAEEVADWENSPHAQTFLKETFQEAWLNMGQPAECLTCHADSTILSNVDVTAHQGVICQSCHGEIPANHGDQPELPPVNHQVCGDCHITTFTEWHQSGHTDQAEACSTCHVPHTQTLVKSSGDELCLDCHTDLAENYAHTTHDEETCLGCHLFKGNDNPNHALDGNLVATGHDNLVITQACTDCHADLAVQSGELVLASEQSPLAAQVQITELESELKTIEAQRSNALAVSTIQGLILGGLIGGLVMIGFSWFRRVR